ncbi:hypothetical protein ACFQ3J_08865 [Paenibacillus provencensis]|uniref:Uncharacterized protein n=1 Tax=Paenibacillus provencensis TaxID=441151 RepID=A0ABW3PVX7_9BACL|nr:hypothetical protein [Paenibacillus sp. MER 78]MCM3128998.1 hypothetical protein [Paenibacillus sp. MER 78]
MREKRQRYLEVVAKAIQSEKMLTVIDLQDSSKEKRIFTSDIKKVGFGDIGMPETRFKITTKKQNYYYDITQDLLTFLLAHGVFPGFVKVNDQGQVVNVRMVEGFDRTTGKIANMETVTVEDKYLEDFLKESEYYKKIW